MSCINFGTASSSGTCQCPVGFGGATCSSILCSNSVTAAANRTAIQNTAGPSGCNSTSQCSSGFTGLDCNLCQTDAACQAAVSAARGSSSSGQIVGDSVQCSTSPYAYTTSFAQCDVLNPTLQAVFPGTTTLKFQRNIHVASTLAQGLSPENTTYAQLWYSANASAFPQEQFYCAADSCIQTNDTTSSQIKLSCNNLQCRCISGAAFCSPPLNLTDTLNGLSGNLQINCGYDGSACSFIQSTLQQLFGQSGLALSSCRFGECVSSTVVQQYSGTGSASASDGLSGGVIAGLAVVGGLVGLVLLALLLGLVAQRRARKGGRQHLSQATPAGLTWSHIGYTLPTQSGAAMSSIFRRRIPHSARSGSTAAHEKNAELPARSNGRSGRVVLDDLSGELPYGAFMAILGPSGAGKSTFVDILAGKRKIGRVRGSVHISSTGDRSASAVRIGYVDQADILPENLTVREALMFAARLKLSEAISDDEKAERVWQVLGQLGLQDIANSRIGSGERRGISGGERRRLSIGLELIALPSILILDEPTSGLDSTSAAKVVAVLRDLAHNEDPTFGRTTIVATIHQPSSQIFHAFDTILVLSSQGLQIYLGPAASATAYFAAQGMPCPKDWNPADHLLDIASSPNCSKQNLIPIHNLDKSRSSDSRGDTSGPPSDDYLASYGGVANRTSDEHDGNNNYVPVKARAARPVTTRLTQFQALSHREFLNLRRDYSLIIMHNVVAAIVGLFVGGLYFKVDTTIAGFQDRIGALFFLGALVAFSALSALSNLSVVKSLFLRERASAYYGPIVWMLSRAIWDIVPLRLLPTVILGVITYWMVGLSPDAAHFFKFLLILVEFSAAITLWNLFLAVVIPQPAVAVLVANVINLAQLAYAGFFVNLSKIPPALRWIQWLNPLKYTLEALSVNEVSGGLMINDVLSGVPVSINAQIIMELLFGFKMDSYYRDVLVLFGWIGLFGSALVLSVLLLRERR